MKQLLLSSLLLLLVCPSAVAYDFAVANDDGVVIYYDIISASTISVTYGGDYSGTVRIPDSVTWNDETYSVTEIGNRAFSMCRDLSEIIFPSTLTTIGEWAFSNTALAGHLYIPETVTSLARCSFYGCQSIEEVTIPNSITKVNSETFRSCSSLTTVTIGQSVEWMGEMVFQDCTSLESVYSLNPTPPECGYWADTFGHVDMTTCVLYVPSGAKEEYAIALQWQKFKNIMEMDMTGIGYVAASTEKAVVGYYTTDGRALPSPQRGLTIVRYSDGTTRKVLVK